MFVVLRLISVTLIGTIIQVASVMASPGEPNLEKISSDCPSCFKEITAATDSLLSRFPLGEFEYVFVGRSPAPIEADLEARGISNFTRIPLSDARGHLAKSENSLKAWLSRKLPIVTEPARTNKKILLIDFADTGTSLTIVQELAHEIYLQGGGRSVEVLALEARYSISRNYFSKYGQLPYHSLKIGTGLANLIVDHELKHFSSTPSFRPSSDPSEPKNSQFERTRFEMLKAWISRLRALSGLSGPTCESLFTSVN